MKITGVDAIPLGIPWRPTAPPSPWTAGLGRHVLVRIGTDEGLGPGLATALHLTASTPGVPWVLLIVGCFMEALAALIILVPVFMPVIKTLGIDPVHFGVVIVLNLMIGTLTPPIGIVLFVVARVAQLPFEAVTRATAPFLVPLVTVLGLITVFPELVLFLPRLVLGP